MVPPLADPQWKRAYRIVNSSFPPISLFEDVLDPEDLPTAYALEALTNDRLMEQAGVLSRVRPEDRISGPGSSPVMAAFTHIGKSSRFSDGTFGVYYAASSQEAAIAETCYHQARFLGATNEPDLELTMRTYVNKVVKPLHDIRHDYPHLHNPDPTAYGPSQVFARQLRDPVLGAAVQQRPPARPRMRGRVSPAGCFDSDAGQAHSVRLECPEAGDFVCV